MTDPELPLESQPENEFVSGRTEFIQAFARRHFHAGRGGRAKLAITTSLISRIVTTCVSFLVLPITVRYLGNEGYGLMATITSVVGWLQFTNMGIGLGLQNALTDETAKGDSKAQKELVSTAFFSLLGIGVILAIVGLVAFPYINWLRIFPPTSDRFVNEIPWTVLIVFGGFVSTVVLGFVGPIYAARQELHLAGIQAMITSVLSLAGIFVAVYFRWGLVGLTACTIGLTALMQWSFALWTLFGRGIGELWPSPRYLTRSAGGRIYRTGLNFFVLQLCNIAFFQIDAFLIAHFVSTDAVTPYNVAQKIFLQTAGIFAIITGSLWAAYGNAKAQGDYAWIRRTHATMVRIFLLFFGFLALFMGFFGHRLLGWWVGNAAAPGTVLIIGVALYFCAREWTALHAMLLNGLDLIRAQVWSLAATAILTLALDLILVRRLGPLGLALGGFIAFALSGAWYLPYLTSKTIGTRQRAGAGA